MTKYPAVKKSWQATPTKVLLLGPTISIAENFERTYYSHSSLLVHFPSSTHLWHIPQGRFPKCWNPLPCEQWQMTSSPERYRQGSRTRLESRERGRRWDGVQNGQTNLRIQWNPTKSPPWKGSGPRCSKISGRTWDRTRSHFCRLDHCTNLQIFPNYRLTSILALDSYFE